MSKIPLPQSRTQQSSLKSSALASPAPLTSKVSLNDLPPTPPSIANSSSKIPKSPTSLGRTRLATISNDKLPTTTETNRPTSNSNRGRKKSMIPTVSSMTRRQTYSAPITRNISAILPDHDRTLSKASTQEITLPPELQSQIQLASSDPTENPERDLKLASELGQTLLKQNEQLQQQYTQVSHSLQVFEVENKELQSEVEVLKRSVDEERERFDVEVRKREGAEREVRELKMKIREFQFAHDDAVSMKEKINALNTAKQSLEQSLTKATKELKYTTGERQSLENTVSELHKQLEEFNEINRNLKTKYKDQIAEHQEMIGKLREDKEELAVQVRKMSNSLLDDPNQKTATYVNSVKSLVSAVRLSTNDLTQNGETDTIILKLQNEIQSLREEKDQLLDVVAHLQNSIRVIENDAMMKGGSVGDERLPANFITGGKKSPDNNLQNNASIENSTGDKVRALQTMKAKILEITGKQKLNRLRYRQGIFQIHNKNQDSKQKYEGVIDRLQHKIADLLQTIAGLQKDITHSEIVIEDLNERLGKSEHANIKLKAENEAAMTAAAVVKCTENLAVKQQEKAVRKISNDKKSYLATQTKLIYELTQFQARLETSILSQIRQLNESSTIPNTIQSIIETLKNSLVAITTQLLQTCQNRDDLLLFVEKLLCGDDTESSDSSPELIISRQQLNGLRDLLTSARSQITDSSKKFGLEFIQTEIKNIQEKIESQQDEVLQKDDIIQQLTKKTKSLNHELSELQMDFSELSEARAELEAQFILVLNENESVKNTKQNSFSGVVEKLNMGAGAEESLPVIKIPKIIEIGDSDNSPTTAVEGLMEDKHLKPKDNNLLNAHHVHFDSQEEVVEYDNKVTSNIRNTVFLTKETTELGTTTCNSYEYKVKRKCIYNNIK
ncbi:hypothetical protein HK098_001747 [Nowakowskiella sp. JEL0407]|nr:hypothetical protein HK098_001747 [Nowakowskiella sp. JEL0407]